jgi:hypothetical protein
VRDRSKCLAGQIAVGWVSGDNCGLYDNANWAGFDSGYAAGCQFVEGTSCGWKLTLSPHGEDSTKTTDCSTSKICLCELTGTVCENALGTSDNGDSCVCGQRACVPGNGGGTFCNSDPSRGVDLCSTARLETCEITDGTAAAEEQCACGDNVCDAGSFCDQGACRAHAPCTEVVGGLNDQTCACGESTCAAGQDPYCYEAGGVCSADGSVFHVFSLTENSASECPQGDYVTDRALCAKAVLTGLFLPFFSYLLGLLLWFFPTDWTVLTDFFLLTGIVFLTFS